MKKTRENSSVKYLLPLKHWHFPLETCKLESKSCKELSGAESKLDLNNNNIKSLLFSYNQILADKII